MGEGGTGANDVEKVVIVIVVDAENGEGPEFSEGRDGG